MGLATGGLFKLGDFPNSSLNQEYLVTGTQFELEESDYASGETGGAPFTCSFQAIESKQPYRSMPTAVKPSVTGLQTAIVTGSETDEDIAVDKYGRVQVTFHWNKPDKKNAKRSEEHTSELQSLMRISYAVFCLKKKKHNKPTYDN